MPNFILKNGAIQSVDPAISIQINSETDLQSDAMQELAPSSIAYTTCWKKAWQKGNDGTWLAFIEEADNNAD